MKYNIIFALKTSSKTTTIERSVEQALQKDENLVVGSFQTAHSVNEIDSILSSNRHKIDILICSELLDGSNNTNAVGKGTILRWKNENKFLKIILIMADEKKASAKADNLYQNGIYTGIFTSDSSPSNLVNMIINEPTAEEAFDRYCLKQYYNKKNQTIMENNISEKEIYTASNNELSNNNEKADSFYSSAESHSVSSTSYEHEDHHIVSDISSRPDSQDEYTNPNDEIMHNHFTEQKPNHKASSYSDISESDSGQDNYKRENYVPLNGVQQRNGQINQNTSQNLYTGNMFLMPQNVTVDVKYTEGTIVNPLSSNCAIIIAENKNFDFNNLLGKKVLITIL